MTNKKEKAPEAKELVIPDLQTAKDQFAYATRYESITLGYVNPDKHKKYIQMDKIAQVHKAVIKNFPSDQEYTPLSKLTIADCDARLGNYHAAISKWQQIMSEYPNNELVQCRAKFSIARAYEQEGQYAKAKEIDKEVALNYGGSSNPRLRQYAAQSESAYLKTREEPKSTSPQGIMDKLFNRS